MTLERQLWLAIVALMLASFVGSFFVSNLSAKAYLEEQLYRKNVDNVTSLALTLSSNEPDPVTRELILAAQFDSGHYSFIELESPTGSLLLGEHTAGGVAHVPGWLVRWFPIEPAAGVAQLSSGWTPQGTLTLQSDARFAYQELWRNTQRLFGYFVAAACFAGVLGSLLLRVITRPLGAVVLQAQAIGERRFITIPEPRTHEFQQLSRAMNGLSTRVKQMISEESERLARWHQSNLRDPLTGLLNRQPFLDQLGALLKRDDASAEGTLVIVRLLHLSELNRRYGRVILDTLLNRLAEQLRHEAGHHEGTLLGRLNGSELAMVAPEHLDPGALANDLWAAMLASCRECSVDTAALAAGATRYGSSDGLTSLLQRVDQALASAEQRDGGGVEVALPGVTAGRNSRDELSHWSHLLERALAEQSFTLQTYPVRSRDGTLLHLEAPSRLVLPDGDVIAAARFMPWAARLGKMPELDLVVVSVALEHIARRSESLGINLSARILEQPEMLQALIERVRAAPEWAPMLWLEVPENGVYARIDGFRTLCKALKPLGCRLGIEHAGPAVAHMGTLYDVGLDYVKLDGALIRAIAVNPGNQAFVRGFCTIAHAIGLRAIAEGVETESEWQCLIELGIDAATGRYFVERG